MLLQALLEQERNDTSPGQVPSGLAMNAYAGSIPLTREQSREAGILGEADRRYLQNREDERKRMGAMEDAKAEASIRGFETRRGVAEGVGTLEDSPAPGQMRTIRRFGTSSQAVDPEAAMTPEQKAKLDPRVLAAEVAAQADRDVAGMKAKPAGSSYSSEKNRRTINAVQDLTKRVSEWTTGYGSLLSSVPRSDARNFAADLDTLKGQVAFGELQAMRDASKTGGALGQVAIRELDLLQSSLGALDQGQSPANMLKNLRQIEDSINRFQDEADRLSSASQPPGGGATADDPYEAYQRRRGGR
jgi:hypothetical protein